MLGLQVSALVLSNSQKVKVSCGEIQVYELVPGLWWQTLTGESFRSSCFRGTASATTLNEYFTDISQLSIPQGWAHGLDHTDHLVWRRLRDAAGQAPSAPTWKVQRFEPKRRPRVPMLGPESPSTLSNHPVTAPRSAREEGRAFLPRIGAGPKRGRTQAGRWGRRSRQPGGDRSARARLAPPGKPPPAPAVRSVHPP